MAFDKRLATIAVIYWTMISNNFKGNVHEGRD